jgi:hypothetical protein
VASRMQRECTSILEQPVRARSFLFIAHKWSEKNFGKFRTERNATGSAVHLSRWARQSL